MIEDAGTWAGLEIMERIFEPCNGAVSTLAQPDRASLLFYAHILINKVRKF
jgi:hypothetical protein